MFPDGGLATPKITSQMRPNMIPAGSTIRGIPNAIAKKLVRTSFHPTLLSLCMAIEHGVYLQFRLHPSSSSSAMHFGQAMDGGRKTYQRPSIKNEVDADNYANQIGASRGPGG